MEKFDGNPINISDYSKKDEKPPMKAVTDKATVRKESGIAKKIFAQDMRTTGRNIFNDTIIPGIKRLLSDMIKRATDLIFYGSYSNNEKGGFTNYNGISSTRHINLSSLGSSQIRQSESNYSRPNVYNVDSVDIDDRGIAEEILSDMRRYVRDYGMVSVADFYSACGLPFAHTDNKFGWKNLDDAYVERLFSGSYRIVLPRVIPIE